MAGYPVTGYYPAGYGYFPDIRNIRNPVFFTPDIRPDIRNPVDAGYPAGYPVSGTKHELFKFSTLYQRKIKTKIDIFRLKTHIIRRLGCSIPRTKSTSRI